MVWRAHRARYPADSDAGARLYSGRYHRGPDCFPGEVTWPVLYLAEEEVTAAFEVVRHIGQEDWPPRNFRFSELEIDLQFVLDCSDPIVIGITMDDLCDDSPDDDCRSNTWELPRRVAEAAIAYGAEATIVPSASRRGNNIIVFTDHMRPESTIRLTGRSYDPQLGYPQPF